MSQITAVLIDSREPDWIKALTFGGIRNPLEKCPMLDSGDILAVTDDGFELLIERKTPDDLLNTLKEKRLFPQIARMNEKRNAQLIAGEIPTVWTYLVVTDSITSHHNGKAITPRGVTGWEYSAVQGALLSVQDMGTQVVYCNGDSDFEKCVLRLGHRSRNPEMIIEHPRETLQINELLDEQIISKVKINLPPARIAKMLSDQGNVLLGLPGIGMETVLEILVWSNGNLSHALSGLTDLSIPAPIGTQRRKTIKTLLGLEDNQSLEILQQKEI